MPVPVQRDPAQTRAKLAAWLSRMMPWARELTLDEVSVPPGAGFSGETLLLEARWRTDDGPATAPLAIRVAPTGHRVYPDARFGEQLRLQRVLDTATDVPVPHVHGDEPDSAVLGAPFFVMDRIQGRVPADLPSYHRSGWVTELPEADRRALWLGGLEILHRIHRLDPKELGLDFLDRPSDGSDGLAQELRHYERYFTFYADRPVPAARTALAWLKDNRPQEPGTRRLLWGDARLGNLVVDPRGALPVAVLDWEMASLGAPEADVAWFLHLDRHLSEGVGLERLEGFPDRADSLAYYEDLAGRPLRHMEYYEVFAAFRFCLITARVTRLVTSSGLLPAGTDLPLHRNATRLLTDSLRRVAGATL